MVATFFPETYTGYFHRSTKGGVYVDGKVVVPYGPGNAPITFQVPASSRLVAIEGFR